MTNLEFLRQLPPEELVKYLSCRACTIKDNPDGCVCIDCNYYQLEWLNEEIL